MTAPTAERPKLEPRYMIGRATSGAQLGGGILYHLTDSGPYGCGRALCGKQPGRHSAGWSNLPGPAATCARCIAKAAR